MTNRKITKILIANRGEIACRVIRSAHEMGIKCIAVYVDADKDAPYVKEADEAILLPDGGYLDGNIVIEAAKRSEAEAIHPGYGFLSENASFARKVRKCRNSFYRHLKSEAIKTMGDKASLRKKL